MLAGCTETGVTLQTLHPTQFDHGKILAQTPPFEFAPPDLMKLVASKGAKLLVDGIREGLFVSQEETPDIIPNEQATETLRPAPKLTSKDRQIKWNTWSADEILRRHSVIGPLWNKVSSSSNGTISYKRIIWVSGFSRALNPPALSIGPGIPLIDEEYQAQNRPSLAVRTCDGVWLRIDKARVEGGGTQDARPALRRAGMRRDDEFLHRPIDPLFDTLK